MCLMMPRLTPKLGINASDHFGTGCPPPRIKRTAYFQFPVRSGPAAYPWDPPIGQATSEMSSRISRKGGSPTFGASLTLLQTTSLRHELNVHSKNRHRAV